MLVFTCDQSSNGRRFYTACRASIQSLSPRSSPRPEYTSYFIHLSYFHGFRFLILSSSKSSIAFSLKFYSINKTTRSSTCKSITTFRPNNPMQSNWPPPGVLTRRLIPNCEMRCAVISAKHNSTSCAWAAFLSRGCRRIPWPLPPGYFK